MPIITGAQHDGIFVWNFDGAITAEDFHGWFLETARVTLASPELRIYHVMDVRKGQTDFGAVLGQMREAGTRPPTLYAPRQVIFLFVGSNEMAKLATTLSRQQQFGGFEMPMFHTMEDAEAFIRVDQQRPIDVKS